MSGATKTVKFQAASKGKNVRMKDIPHTVGPDALSMAGGPGATERKAADLASTSLRDRTATDEQFPTDSLGHETEEDELMLQKLELQSASEAKGQPGVTPFGILTSGDSDFNWLEKKREQEAKANFMQWFASNFDKMSPEQKAMARELAPDFYAERLSFLKQQVNLAERIARLKIEGIKNKEDMMLQYAIESGFIDGNPLENIMHPEKAAAAQNKAKRQAAFGRGLLNRRGIRGNWGDRTRETNATELTGRGAAQFPTQAFNFGVGGNGFSAIGTPTNAQEQYPRFAETLGMLQR